MRTKSTKTTIIYAGRTLVQPGGHFDGDSISSSLNTTASSYDLIGSTHSSIESHYNAKSSLNLSFVHDFESVEEALLFKLEVEDHAIANQTGELSIAVDESRRTYLAGLESIDSTFSLVTNAVRLVLQYSFILGKSW